MKRQRPNYGRVAPDVIRTLGVPMPELGDRIIEDGRRPVEVIGVSQRGVVLQRVGNIMHMLWLDYARLVRHARLQRHVEQCRVRPIHKFCRGCKGYYTRAGFGAHTWRCKWCQRADRGEL